MLLRKAIFEIQSLNSFSKNKLSNPQFFYIFFPQHGGLNDFEIKAMTTMKLLHQQIKIMGIYLGKLDTRKSDHTGKPQQKNSFT